jgi:hypothetical protein
MYPQYNNNMIAIIIIKTWSQIYNSQCRNTNYMEKQSNMSPSKVSNSTIKDLNRELDEISNNVLKRMMIRMINEIKEDM